MPESARDRFDEIPHAQGRVGAHRAENPGMRGWFVLLWAAVATVVLIAVGIFAAMLAMGKISFDQGTPMPSVSRTATASAPPLDKTYAVFVLNATGANGLAAATRDTIVNAGFAADAVVAGDADSQDFPTSTVYYKTAADENAARALADLVGAKEIAQSDRYGDDVVPGQKQLTVVLGMDLAKNAPTTEPTPADTSGDGSAG
ncbi:MULTISPECIES: LytR C-terminal domain-containing protein [unclassified Microbacterium]|mgnify:FL=1|uniref:LytR C-terminal domain-containing protein n=1 Tax=unclassified Microbacterium TaxID=2609290 RepID=UPI001AD1A6BC|nr:MULTISPECIES: LytR C-terminal domain-containing protein [unclassified Microbacterium]MBN9157454.1 LytR C-terminal domain-containing protein [Microbacterium sp.]MBS1897106.1 LytR C-terminal domain-containing protein [Actinomycetota bacterium]MBS1902028.1 LytR C-terminal domain-containing protein [Actinomycetota bacterium]